MALKTYKPSTPGLRQLAPRRSLRTAQGQAGQVADRRQAGEGRAQQLRPRHRAVPRRRSQAVVPHRRLQAPQVRLPAKVERLEYDPNRTSFIALIRYADGEQAYIIAPQRLSVGDEVVSGVQVDVKPGNAMPLANIPVGTIVHNVELKIGKGGAIARSAGTYAQIVGRDQGYVSIRLYSGEQRLVHGQCFATVGSVSNPDHMNASLGKAGRNRWLGHRPHNRGVTMNPVDHPHGGGEGRTSGGRHPVTPWGKPTKGKKTRSNKSTDKFIVASRHVRKKKG